MGAFGVTRRAAARIARAGLLATLAVGMAANQAQAANPTATGTNLLGTIVGSRLIITADPTLDPIADNLEIRVFRFAPGSFFGGLPATQCTNPAGDPVDVELIEPVPEEEVFIIQVTDNNGVPVPEDMFDPLAIAAGYTLPDGTTVPTGDSCDYQNRDQAEALRADLENLLPLTDTIESIFVAVLDDDDIVDCRRLTGDGAVPVEVEAGPGDDIVLGGSADDFLKGQDGDDIINGNLGGDTIEGGDGNDYLVGGPEIVPPGETAEDDDDITGGDGLDLIRGGIGADTISGGPDDDVIIGGEGDDALQGGGDPSDVLDYRHEGGPGAVTVDLSVLPGTASDTFGTSDTIGSETSIGFSVLWGSVGSDNLTGISGLAAEAGTTILGDGGGDTIRGGRRGGDLLFGGTGNDTIYAYNAPADEASVHGDPGGDDDSDIVYGGGGSDRIFGGRGSDILFGDGDPEPTDPADPLCFITFSDPMAPFRSPIVSITPIRTLLPRDFNRELTQFILPEADFGGSDEIHGGGLADTIVGGGGLDIILGCQDSKDGTVCATGDDGSDEIFGDYHVPIGSPPDTSTDVLMASGDDRIRAGPGLDMVLGGGGDDDINGDADMDLLYGDENYDYVDTTSGLWFPFRGVNDGVLDSDPAAVPGNDLIYGGADPDLIFGGGGSDDLIGGADYFLLGGFGDSFQPQAGFDSIIGGNVYLIPEPTDDAAFMASTDPAKWIRRGVGFPSPALIPTGDLDTLFDTVDYSTAHAAVTADLGEDASMGGFAMDDGDGSSGFPSQDFLILDIENMIGSDFDDTLYGSNVFVPLDPYGMKPINELYVYVLQDPEFVFYPARGEFDNIILGRGGNDTIMGRLGEDYLVGADGNDTLCGDSDQTCDPSLTDAGVAALGHTDLLRGDAGNDRVYGNGGNDVVRGGTGADTLSGGAELDVLDYSEFDEWLAAPVVINLRDTAVNLRTLEQTLDTVLADTGLFSNDADHNDDLGVFEALGGGGTMVVGVQPMDTATDPGDPSATAYVAPATDVIINRRVTEDDPATPTLDESQDRFEVVLGTTGRDVIFGSEARPTAIAGRSGDDVLIGGDGTALQTMGPYAGIYSDVIYGDDVVAISFLPRQLYQLMSIAASGDDVIEGGLGNDYMDGGVGPVGVIPIGNVLSYANTTGQMTQGVTVSLADSQPQATGGAGTDTILHFQHLIGSPFGDTLSGDAGDNRVNGMDGDDALRGGPGDDRLHGGPGYDLADYRDCVFCADPLEFVFTHDPATGDGVVPNDGQGGSDILIQIQQVLTPVDQPDPDDPTGGSGDGSGGGQGDVSAPVKVDAGDDEYVTLPGGQVTLRFTVTGGLPPYTAVWDPTTAQDTTKRPPVTVTILIYNRGTQFGAGEEQTAIAKPLATTSFRVTVNDSLGNVAAAFVVVKVAATLAVDAGRTQSIIRGDSVTLSPRSVTGGVQPYGYEWTAAGDGGFQSSPNAPSVIVSPPESTTYTLTVRDALGTWASDTVEVNVTAVGSGAGSADGGSGVPAGDAGTPATDSTEDDAAATGSVPTTPDPEPRASALDEDSAAAAPRVSPLCGSGAASSFMLANLLLLTVKARRRRLG